MKVECPISVGELVDKLSILKIKIEKFSENQEKKNWVEEEYNILRSRLKSLNLDSVEGHFNKLFEVNTQLWQIEDRIREKELQKCFDESFIELARAVYHKNDERFSIKDKINALYGSELREMKEYQSY